MRLARLHTMVLNYLDIWKKSAKLFGITPKTCTSKKHHLAKHHFAKQTKFFMKKIDYARLRNYSIKTLLAYEIGFMPYYLFKKGNL